MIRKLFAALVLLIASVAAALWLRDHEGFVIVKLDQRSVQTSLVVFAAALVVLWIILSLGWGLLSRLLGIRGRVRRWIYGRRRGHSRDRLVNGLIQVAEGHYDQAERMLTRHPGADGLPLFHYLLAAIAAHRKRDTEARDRYLTLADESEAGAGVAVGLLQAQFQLESHQWEQALATLTWLRERAPGNRRVLGLLYRCAVELEDWERAAELMPQLKRYSALPVDELTALERGLGRSRLEAVVSPGAEQRLASVWQSFSRAERRDPELRAYYARCLIRSNESETAAGLLRGWLKKDWDDRLVAIWGELDGISADAAFEQADRWLAHRPNDPVLLRAAALQALRAGHWDHARTYLEAAVADGGDAATERLLGDLYHRLGETELAQGAWQRALDASLGRPAVTVPALPSRPSQETADSAAGASASS